MIEIIFFFQRWLYLVEEGTINIVSHVSLIKDPIFVEIFNILLIISLLFLVWCLVRKRNKNILLLFLIFLGYVLFIFFGVNYSTYLKTRNELEGVQGRYLFPVLGPLVIIMAYSLLNVFKNKLINILIFCFVSFFFIYSDFGYFYSNYYKWYFSVPGLSYKYGNVGQINKGQSSPKQVFSFKENSEKNYGLGIYISTYSNEIKKGFKVNLFDGDCNKILWIYEPKKIKDNFYLSIKLPNNLDKNNNYCFNIENDTSNKPITVWYSSVDLPGNVFEEMDKDLIYDLLDQETTERFK
ncbi:MAG: DUF2142 domain-containing protein [Candidatus Shapirobacteria bacterium]|nr:DUF2142 domain-containing protein [Candidatus Shapirobacteria bacterium]MDD3002711.1 DUF2142 domain-containing protein [Candidatus Shapirobacteria bacterium]MDD4383210.1 DUF2142 domain-containing protein [Candidatus Shapirobacteria bacterium]